MNDELRFLCLPPAEAELLIQLNCNEGEVLDACIERLEAADDTD